MFRVEVLSIGFAVKNPLIKQYTNVLEGCLPVHVLYKAFSDSMSVIFQVSVVVHIPNTILDPCFVLISLIFFLSEIYCSQLHYRKFIIKIVIPFGFEVTHLNLVQGLVRESVICVLDWHV